MGFRFPSSLSPFSLLNGCFRWREEGKEEEEEEEEEEKAFELEISLSAPTAI